MQEQALSRKGTVEVLDNINQQISRVIDSCLRCVLYKISLGFPVREISGNRRKEFIRASWNRQDSSGNLPALVTGVDEDRGNWSLVSG